MNPSVRRYGYGAGLVVVLALVAMGLSALRPGALFDDKTRAYVSEESVSVSVDGTTKTYTNPQAGFSFTYPAGFYLTTPFPEVSQDVSLTDDEREEKFQNDQQAWRDVLERINGDTIERGEGAAYEAIDISIIDPANLPTREEEKERCKEERRMNPQLSLEDACAPSLATHEDLEEERLSIESGTVGEKLPDLGKTIPGGVIVQTGSVRGVRGLFLSPDTGVYNATFSTYTADGKRVTLSLQLVQDTYPEIVSADDLLLKQKAIDDPRNKVLDGIISSFVSL